MERHKAKQPEAGVREPCGGGRLLQEIPGEFPAPRPQIPCSIFQGISPQVIEVVQL
jgi:hypothetical protein